jgi:hypothetical protein
MSRWEVRSGDLSGRDEETRGDVQLASDDYPGWLFNIDFDDAGAVVRFEVIADSFESRGLSLAGAAPCDEPGAPLNARLIHDLPFGEIVAAARADLAAWASDVDRVAPDMAARRQHFAAVLRERPGRRGRTDLEYARLAAEYAELIFDGDTMPVVTLAEELHVAESTVRNQLSEARRRGLLTATKPGRAGGRLTAKAQRLLKEPDHGTH